jgi:hypothetical protein
MPIAGILLLMISFLIMIVMTSVVFNGSFVNNRNFVSAYAASDNKTAPRSTYALEGPDSVNISNETIMKQLLSSNKPDDIVTLAYICGYPLVRAEVTKDYMTNPRVSGFGPVNQFHPVTETCKCKLQRSRATNCMHCMIKLGWILNRDL